MRRLITLTALLAVAIGLTGFASAQTTVPGHQDNSGTVNGHYTAVYAYDANGDYYLDYGDDRPGNPAGTVDSIDELDQSTLTVCDYVINYRGDFGDDPYLDNGTVFNHIRCHGYEGNTVYNHRTEYPGEERQFNTVSGEGNTVNNGQN